MMINVPNVPEGAVNASVDKGTLDCLIGLYLHHWAGCLCFWSVFCSGA